MVNGLLSASSSASDFLFFILGSDLFILISHIPSPSLLLSPLWSNFSTFVDDCYFFLFSSVSLLLFFSPALFGFASSWFTFEVVIV